MKVDPLGYVLKPFEDRELAVAVRMGLAKHAAERRLKESESRFEAVLKSVADGIIATNARGQITYFNPSAEKLTGWTMKEAVGRGLSEIFPLLNDGTHEPETDFFSRFLLPDVTFGACPTALLRCKDGRETPIEYRAAHMRSDESQVAGAIISFWDITERRQAEAAAERAQSELLSAHASLASKHDELQTFYHTVSHEVKTPLTSAREFVSLVLEGLAGPINPTQAEYLSIAQQSCDQMRTCINDMLDVTRLETGKMRVELTPGELGPLVERVAKVLQPAATQKQLNFSCTVDPATPSIAMDETRIAQVVTNLLNNAIKFTPERGTVSLIVRPGRSGFAEIEVTDTGRGIPEQQLERIFDRLYQVRTEDSMSCMGLGLGLYICKELSELHGGSIRVESVEGSGTTFIVELPVCPPSPVSVLVVDEDADMVQILRRTLAHEGFEVRTARNGREAILQLEKSVPSLIVMDLVMPEIDGPDLIQHVRSHHGRLPIVVLTAYPDSDLIARALDSSPFTLFSKDSDLSLLVGAITELTGGSRLNTLVPERSDLTSAA